MAQPLAKALAITDSLLATRYSDTRLSCDSIHNSSWAIHNYLPGATEAQNHFVERGGILK